MKQLIKKAALLLVVLLAVGCTSTDSKGTSAKGEDKLMTNLETTMLVNKNWQLVEINGESISYEKSRITPTIEFSANADSVSGNSSCNNFMGHVQIDGNKIRFKDMVLTRRACLDKNLEGEYMAALNNSVYTSVEGYELTLFDGNKSPILKFLQP